MGAQKEEENVHNFPIYTFDKNARKFLKERERHLVYRKNWGRPDYKIDMEFMLPDGTLTKDIHIDYWFGVGVLEENLREGADYLGIGVVHTWFKGA